MNLRTLGCLLLKHKHYSLHCGRGQADERQSSWQQHTCNCMSSSSLVVFEHIQKWNLPQFTKTEKLQWMPGGVKNNNTHLDQHLKAWISMCAHRWVANQVDCIKPMKRHKSCHLHACMCCTCVLIIMHNVKKDGNPLIRMPHAQLKPHNQSASDA